MIIWLIAYLRLSSVDACEEKEVGQEEAEGELQVEGGAGVLDGPAQEEGEDGQEEAQQGEDEPHLGDHGQHRILLQATKGGIFYSFQLCCCIPDGKTGGLLSSVPEQVT